MTINTMTRTPFAKHMVDTSDCTSIDGVLTKAGLDFRVEKVPVYTEPLITDDGVTTLRMPNDAAIVAWRDGVPTPFRTVTSGYGVVQNSEIAEPLSYLWDEGFIERIEQAGHLDGGQRVFLLAKLASECSLSDPHHRYIMLTTTHDGSGAIKAQGWMRRLHCANQVPGAIARGHKRAIFSIRHTRNAAQNVTAMRTAILSSIKVMDEYDDTMRQLMDTPVTSEQHRFFTEMLLPYKAPVQIKLGHNNIYTAPGASLSLLPRGERIHVERVERARRTFSALTHSTTVENVAGTLAAYFHAAVEYSDYHVKNAGERILKGSDIAFKQRALELATSQL